MSRRIPFVLMVLILGVAPRAFACAACFGGANNATIDGMNAAIWIMLAITISVFAGIVVFALAMRRRARALFDRTPGTAFLNEHGILQWKNS